jgi:hypothetical protein
MSCAATGMARPRAHNATSLLAAEMARIGFTAITLLISPTFPICGRLGSDDALVRRTRQSPDGLAWPVKPLGAFDSSGESGVS